MLRHGLAGLNPSSSNAALILDLILSRSTTSRRNLSSPEHVRASLSTPRMQPAIAIARPPVAPQPRQMATASRPGFLPSRPSRRTAVRAARDDSADQEPTFALVRVDFRSSILDAGSDWRRCGLAAAVESSTSAPGTAALCTFLAANSYVVVWLKQLLVGWVAGWLPSGTPTTAARPVTAPAT